jgi:hypothetical protein
MLRAYCFWIMIDLVYLLHCIIMLLAHAFAYLLVHAESEFEEPTKQAQVEAITNLVWIKASSDAFNQCLVFSF